MPPGSFWTLEDPVFTSSLWSLQTHATATEGGLSVCYCYCACVFGGVEAFPICLATATSVPKILIEKIIPTQGTPFALHSDRRTLFTGQIIQ